MKITCTADLHGYYPELPGGDLLIIAGDLTASDKQDQHWEFQKWACEQDYKRVIFISGNHDNWLQSNECGGVPDFDGQKLEYLCDSGTEFEGLKIWGSPWTAQFPGINPKCCAFTMPFGCDTEEHLMDQWRLIPTDTDILITHGPAYGILDGIPQMHDGTIHHAGNKSLFSWLKYVGRPRYHIFGHIHEAYGQEEYFATYNDKMMKSINCSHVNERYKPVNKPMSFEI